MPTVRQHCSVGSKKLGRELVLGVAPCSSPSCSPARCQVPAARCTQPGQSLQFATDAVAYGHPTIASNSQQRASSSRKGAQNCQPLSLRLRTCSIDTQQTDAGSAFRSLVTRLQQIGLAEAVLASYRRLLTERRSVLHLASGSWWSRYSTPTSVDGTWSIAHGAPDDGLAACSSSQSLAIWTVAALPKF